MARARPGGPAWPHVDGVEHRFVSVNGVQLHYAEAGQGEPIVLVHGWPQHWWAWRDVIGRLAESYRVICPDVRGLGWSEGSAAGYRIDELAGDVVGLLDALGIEQTRLVGHDWGSIIGYRACFDHPERFTQFVALGALTPWAAQGAPLRLWLRPWHIFTLGALGTSGTTTFGIPENSLRAWRHVDAFTPSEVHTYLDVLRRPPAAHATHAYYRNVALHELPHYLLHHRDMHLRVPTMHLNGAHDPLTRGTPDSYRKYAPDMRLEVIPDCGHFIPEERPEVLLERLGEFFGTASDDRSVPDGNQ